MATLGDLLKTLADLDLASPGPSEPIAAASAYIPGYDEKSPNSEPRPEGEGRPDLVDEGTDLAHGVKKKLAEYAVKNILEEGPLGGNPSPSKDYDDQGHSRQDALRKAQVEGANHYDPEFFEKDNQTNYAGKVAHEDLKNQIIDKRERPGKATLGRQLKALKSHASEASTFGRKQRWVDLADPGTDEPIPDATYELLKDNKYNPSSQTPFLKGDSSRGDQQLSKGMYGLYSGLFGKSTNSDDNYPKGVTVKDLRKAALEMLYRGQSVGVGHSATIAEQMLSSGSPFVSKVERMAFIPHLTQVGAGTILGGVDALRIRNAKAMEGFSDLDAVGQDDLIVVESYETIMGAGGPEDPDLKAIPRNGKSYGTMNSPGEPFNGIAPFGMIMPVLYSIVVLGLMGMLFGAILSGFGSAAKNFKGLNAENPASLAFGLNALKGTDWAGAEIGQKFLNMFGLPSDVGLEWHSMVRGIMLFYGIDINPFQPGAAIADAFINLLMGPGYYLVISKKVLADFEQVTHAFQNYTNISGGFSAITIFLASLEALASSFTFRWFIIMNNVGRIDEDGRVRSGAKAHGQSVIPLGSLHKKKPLLTPYSRNTMSRWYPSKKGSIPLSPLSARLHYAALLSGEYLGGAKSGHPQKNVPGPMGVQDYITHEQREFIEEEIDGEYVPFSVQDLRTGEIISLPAFITSINDDFQAEYSQTQGFGRTDPVNIYKSTKRNISISFKVVAMNPEDHDYIWFVINKFVSMVYPQRDAGRKRFQGTDQDNTIEFIQPFSQVVAASPVIRIRVGDLIASNASSTGFAKLFGDPSIASNEAGASEQESVAKLRAGMEALRKLSVIRTDVFYDMLLEDWGTEAQDSSNVYLREGCPAYVTVDEKHYVFNLKYGIVVHDPKLHIVPKDGDKEKKAYNTFKVHDYVTDEIDAMALGGNPMLTAYRKSQAFSLPPPPFGPDPDVTITVPCDLAQAYISDKLSVGLQLTLQEAQEGKIDAEKIVDRLAKKFQKAEDDAEKEVIKKFKETEKAKIEGLIAAVNEVAADLSDQLGNDVDITNFMSPSNNAIIRSMRRSGGRGLAGVITTLNLNYDQTVWGTTFDTPSGRETGRRAPKFVTITMNFQPMHDLPLGLNHKGEMFAPSHPVGSLSRAKLNKPAEALSVDERIEEDRQQARRSVGALPTTDNPGELKLPF